MAAVIITGYGEIKCPCGGRLVGAHAVITKSDIPPVVKRHTATIAFRRIVISSTARRAVSQGISGRTIAGAPAKTEDVIVQAVVTLLGGVAGTSVVPGTARAAVIGANRFDGNSHRAASTTTVTAAPARRTATRATR